MKIPAIFVYSLAIGLTLIFLAVMTVSLRRALVIEPETGIPVSIDPEMLKPGYAEEHGEPGDGIYGGAGSISNYRPTTFTINFDDNKSVTVNLEDGTVAVTGMTLEESGRKFWEYVEFAHPQFRQEIIKTYLEGQK